jgi:hypothetical protein
MKSMFDLFIFLHIISFCNIDTRLAFGVLPNTVKVPARVCSGIRQQLLHTRKLRNVMQPHPEISRVVRRIDIAANKSMVIMVCKRKIETWTELQVPFEEFNTFLMCTAFSDHGIEYLTRR